jgi:RNA polymerase sigma-32 factor
MTSLASSPSESHRRRAPLQEKYSPVEAQALAGAGRRCKRAARKPAAARTATGGVLGGSAVAEPLVLQAAVPAPVRDLHREVSARAQVQSNTLEMYMKAVRRYPLLTLEAEHELAVEFERTRDPMLAQRLITANLRLVVMLAYRYSQVHRSLLDLIQEGNMGLILAVHKYDPHRGVKLSAFAAWWIRAYMLRAMLHNWRLVKIGTTQAQRKLFFRMNREWKKLEAAGCTPTDAMMAERLCVNERDVADMRLRLGQSEISLDAPVKRGGQDGRTGVDMLEESESSRPDLVVEQHQFSAVLRDKMKIFESSLVGREEAFFQERLMSEQPLTLREIGQRYGISRERARQLEARLLVRLKSFLQRELGNSVPAAECA